MQMSNYAGVFSFTRACNRYISHDLEMLGHSERPTFRAETDCWAAVGINHGRDSVRVCVSERESNAAFRIDLSLAECARDMSVRHKQTDTLDRCNSFTCIYSVLKSYKHKSEQTHIIRLDAFPEACEFRASCSQSIGASTRARAVRAFVLLAHSDRR